ncbi:hypothetical protein N7466_001918 [Penicillium verhagenii]|uniref:uncharacterized protein n=1 Tax=Penicillium verhagenii TaxID=1562060 RepID=UPI0025454BB5|nr:uncharacterized protein N7466_001918 [Penicillium verhagenii]KAJ5938784.1 hypothetical protein N7466_001918 [Penicillium verhagenii]
MPSATKTRFLSVILQNPPDTHAPQGMPVVSLTTVEISLDCGFLFRPEKDPHERRNTVNNKNAPWFHFLSCPNLAADLTLDSYAGFTNFTENNMIPLEDRIDHSSRSLHALVDFCLQKLLSSATTKFSGIHVIDNNLQTLQQLAPAIFNPEYREAMNQRSVSCPIIAKAVNSMLATTSNPILQKEVSKIHRDGKQWIADSLWCMAQTNLRQLKFGNKLGSFRSQGQGTDEPQTNAERAVAASFTEDIFHEGEILDFGNDWSLEIDNEWELEASPQTLRTDVDDETDGPLLGSSGESSFQDLYESTQTTLDSLPLPEIVPSQLTDTEMLLFDCDLE